MSGSFGKSSSKGQNSSQSTSTQALNPANENAQLQNVSNAQGLLDTYKPYTGELVAPTNATQEQGYTSLLNTANNNPGAGTLADAVSGAQGVTNYTPQTVTAGQLSDTNLSPYLNPYTQDVIGTTNANLQRQNQITNEGNDAQATAAGAFGGDRSAVLDSLTNAAYALQGATTDASLNQANYTNAQSAAEQDIAAQQAAATSNQQAGLTGANLNLQGATEAGALSNEQQQQAITGDNLIQAVGNAQQTQAQNVDTAAQQNNQQTIANQQSYQTLINAALAALGNPTLTQQQSTSQGTNSSNMINATLSSSPAK